MGKVKAVNNGVDDIWNDDGKDDEDDDDDCDNGIQ